MTHANCGVKIHDGRVAGRLRVTVRHAHHERLLQPQDIAKVRGEIPEERQLRRARITEDRVHTKRAQQAQNRLSYGDAQVGTVLARTLSSGRAFHVCLLFASLGRKSRATAGFRPASTWQPKRQLSRATPREPVTNCNVSVYIPRVPGCECPNQPSWTKVVLHAGDATREAKVTTDKTWSFDVQAHETDERRARLARSARIPESRDARRHRRRSAIDCIY